MSILCLSCLQELWSLLIKDIRIFHLFSLGHSLVSFCTKFNLFYLKFSANPLLTPMRNSLSLFTQTCSHVLFTSISVCAFLFLYQGTNPSWSFFFFSHTFWYRMTIQVHLNQLTDGIPKELDLHQIQFIFALGSASTLAHLLLEKRIWFSFSPGVF